MLIISGVNQRIFKNFVLAVANDQRVRTEVLDEHLEHALVEACGVFKYLPEFEDQFSTGKLVMVAVILEAAICHLKQTELPKLAPKFTTDKHEIRKSLTSVYKKCLLIIMLIISGAAQRNFKR